ncbi:hypothetical protein OIE66_12920 [Nonomuraea sp. NBC_01738]|uniref:hypothetical protein n=1 Tax=Nonomuraea sp. NBC_01738 TaxID=2976003 RepID=UPI002E1038A0|nr:hypothetical protein OIE66_12920 [Nonomuraea sp. NBC_01738]
MRIGQAREVAAEWVAGNACEGAFLSGSASWAPDDAELAPASDMDVMVVVDGARPKLGKFRHKGVLLEVTYLTWDDLPSAEHVLGHYHLAGAFRRDNVLADPGGRLRALVAEVAPRWGEGRWVRARCGHAEAGIVAGLDLVPSARPYPMRVMRWLFAAGVTTHVLLTAALRNPTVRLRYPAVREVVDAEFYEELLALQGSAGLSARQVRGHVAGMAEIFDEAAVADSAAWPFGSDLSPQARHIAVDGSLELVERGLHREAVFWIAATYARGLLILGRESSPGFDALLADLGAGRPEERAPVVRAFLPRLRQRAEELISRRDGGVPPPVAA